MERAEVKIKNSCNMNVNLQNASMLFSIIIPVYKTESYLSRCIDSILSQTYQNFELILVDDGSPDNCPQICDEYARRDNRVHVFHKENGGAASARNIGIRASCGDYIMFTDSDDYWNDRSALQRIAKAIIAYQCDVLCTNLCKTNARTQDEKKYFASSDPLIGAEEVFWCERYISSPCSKIIKSQLFLNGQLDFVEGIGSEDIDWSLRVALLSERMVYIDLSFYCYLQRETSSSHSMTFAKLNDLKNNILTCIQLLYGSNQSEAEDFLPYVSYQYAVLLLNIASVSDKKEQSLFLSGLKELSYFLRFSHLPKVRMMHTANRLLGFQGMMELLSAYAKIMKRGILCQS